MGDRKLLSVRDDDDLQWYVGTGHDFMSISPLGAMLDAARDSLQPQSGLRDFWKFIASAADTRQLKNARRIAVELWGAHMLCPHSVSTLWAYCHPTAVQTCEGLYGNVGRLLAVYPMTETGRHAVDGHLRPLVRRGQLNPTNSLRQMNADRCKARGEDARAWARIRAEAITMRDDAVTAYLASAKVVRAHYKEFGMPPTRGELSGLLGAG